MNTIDRILRAVSSTVSSVALIVLLVVVAGNIAGRAFFDLTGGSVNLMISSAIEIATYSLLILVFGAVSNAIPGGLVQVDVLNNLFPRHVAVLLEIVWLLIMALGAGVIAYLFYETAIKSASRGATTQDLGLPLSIFYFVAAVQCAVVMIIAFIAAGRSCGLLKQGLYEKEAS